MVDRPANVCLARLGGVREGRRDRDRLWPSHPSRQLQIVSNLEGGVVKAILVKPGTRVTAGQPLVELDNTQFTAEFGKTTETYNALVARAARLQAEVTGRSPTFPTALTAAAPQLVATERALYVARLSELAAARGGRAGQARSGRTGARHRRRSKQAMRADGAALADREVAMVAPLVEKGIEPQIELLRAQTAQGQARGAADAARRWPSSSANGRRCGGAIRVTRRVRDRHRSQAVEPLTQTSAELANQGKTLPALGDRGAAVLRAPVPGIVNRVLVATVGGTVHPGEPLIESSRPTTRWSSRRRSSRPTSPSSTPASAPP